MMTSLLLVDVQGFEALAKGQADPSALASELTHTMHGLTRQIAVMRAYCSTRVSTYRRTAYREAGFEIVETAGADETLILMSLDLYELSASDATYEETIILGGTTDYTALARLARERLMMVSVADHSSIPPSLEALADGLVDLDDLEIERSPVVTPSASFKPRERTKPDPLAARTPTLSRPEKAQTKVDVKTEEKADAKVVAKSNPITVSSAAPAPGLASAGSTLSTANGAAHVTSAKSDTKSDAASEKTDVTPKADGIKEDAKPAETKSAAPVTRPTAAPLLADKSAALEAELENAIGSSLPDDLSSELEAELSAELLADVPTASTSEKPAMDVTANNDTNIDALFANMTSASDIGASSTETTSVDPAVKVETTDVPPLAEPEADTDVDELLSRLMSDDLASDAPTEKKASLNVVPER